MNIKAQRLAKAAIKHRNWLQKLPILPKMFSAIKNKQYKLRRSTKLWLGFAFLYLISPIDLVPDFIFPIIGFGDDFALALYACSKLFDEVSYFELSQQENGPKTYVIDEK
jgi:uncharacterized membrane protein YkvA (DUF1232 family)